MDSANISNASASGHRQAPNVGKAERVISAVAGSLLLYHFTRKHKAETLLLLAGGYLLYRGASGHCNLYSALERNRHLDGHPRNINVRASVVVSRPRAEVYAFWRELSNLPKFMKHLDFVHEIDDKRSSWTAKVPGWPGSIGWEAEIVKEEEGSELSWHSVANASIDNAGKISFSDTPGKATRVEALISYRPPMGKVGEGISRLLNPLFRDMIEKDILGFKHFMENEPASSATGL
jgi:uncharacterized membrane protein